MCASSLIWINLNDFLWFLCKTSINIYIVTSYVIFINRKLFGDVKTITCIMHVLRTRSDLDWCSCKISMISTITWEIIIFACSKITRQVYVCCLWFSFMNTRYTQDITRHDLPMWLIVGQSQTFSNDSFQLHRRLWNPTCCGVLS